MTEFNINECLQGLGIECLLLIICIMHTFSCRIFGSDRSSIQYITSGRLTNLIAVLRHSYSRCMNFFSINLSS